jgi:glycerol-3-phosphate dehydrogenase (NAD(P)+)
MDIAVIGTGSYGTALAKVWGERGHRVTLWCRRAELAEEIEHTRENAAYLPGCKLPATVSPTHDLAEAVRGKPIVVGVTPSHALREVLGRAAPHLDPDVIVVNASKGLEEGTLLRVDEMYAEIFSPAIAARAVYLSGPTFAAELAQRLPSAIVIAGRDEATRERAQRELAADRFRVYTSDDVVGVLLGGALKNVVAIGAGISDGLGFGLNARAALITRGLAEITRLGVRLGANPLTFAGLSGLGDLVLTCSGELSRNRRVGLAVGRGQKIADVIAEMRMVAEGVKTTRVAHQLAEKSGVEAPVARYMYRVLYEDLPAAEGLAELMGRALKDELD